MEKINGIIEKVIHRNGNGFIIFSLRIKGGSVPVTGEDMDLYESDSVTCQGTWTTYKGEPQFKATKILPDIPVTTDAVLRYVASGRIPGVGEGFAKRLVKQFGKDLFRVIEEEPERLKEVKGLGKKRIDALKTGLMEQFNSRVLMVFLHEFNLPKRVIKKISDTYGLMAYDKVRNDPYSLCREVSGIGFAIADRIGLKVGIDPSDMNRLMAGMEYIQSNRVNTEGSTGILRDTLIQETMTGLAKGAEVDEQSIITCLDNLLGENTLYEMEVDGSPYVFSSKHYHSERGIARNLKRLMEGSLLRVPASENIDGLIDRAQESIGKELDETQRNAVKTALLNPVSIITGGPGTGKTTILRVIIECLTEFFKLMPYGIGLCAPTGKAAKRVSESTGMEASTVHRLLEYSPIEGGFVKDRSDPLDMQLIVIDEASMLDVELMYALVQAIDINTRFVIVGDIDQLPSVGAGKVLKDLIDSGKVETTRLTNIHRQAEGSYITLNAHAMNKGQMPKLKNMGRDSDFYFLGAQTDQEIQKTVCSLIDRLSEHYGYDRFDDIQVLTPMRKGAVGIYELNEHLQEMLNGHRKGTGLFKRQDDRRIEFMVDDKVMHIKNNMGLGVFNGETGRIKAVDIKKKTLTVTYEDKDVEYAESEIDELRLAYAMTIHKSQGSEYPCVIMVASTSHYNMLYRSLFYTGVTRASRTLAAVGQERAFKIAVNRESMDQRVTGLLEHILAA